MTEERSPVPARIHAVARVTVALIWFYHGLVPKLLLHHPDELALLTAGGLAPETAASVVVATGWAEILFAVLLLATWRLRWFMLANVPLMGMATVVVALNAPRYLGAAFNPVSLNAAVIALSAIAFLAQSAPPISRNGAAGPPN
ncbi:MAG: DoxX-like family protein [Planctomycetes bacterium]|nr:DoxX-like family protein [Planctomycetota bacterium]